MIAAIQITPITISAALAGICFAFAMVELLRASTVKRKSVDLQRGLRLFALIGRGTRLKVPGDLSKRLLAAGSQLTVREAVAIKAGGALSGFALGFLFGTLLPGRAVIATGAIGALIGFASLDLYLLREAKQRRLKIAVELPDILDLLRVSVVAGHSIWRAIEEVAQRHRGVAANEFGLVSARIRLGQSRAKSLELLKQRCQLATVDEFVDAIIRSDRHGVEVERVLRGQASSARSELGRRAREQAAQAGPKIQLVAALLLVPAVLLLITAALLPRVF